MQHDDPTSRASKRNSDRVKSDRATGRANKKPSPLSSKALSVSVPEFCRLTSLGRTTAYKLMRANAVETRRICGRTVILTRSIEALLELGSDEGAADG